MSIRVHSVKRRLRAPYSVHCSAAWSPISSCDSSSVTRTGMNAKWDRKGSLEVGTVLNIPNIPFITNPTPFAAQLEEIYKSSLAAIICRNSDGILHVRQHVMERRRRNGNRDVDCVELEGFEFNFEPWSEDRQAAQLHKATFSQPMSLVRVMKAPNPNHTRVHT